MNRLGIWARGLRIGLATVRREPRLGVKRLGLPVSYWRAAEFAYVFRALPPGPGARVLDVGSPKDLAAMLARSRQYEMVATDILPQAIEESERFAAAQGLSGRGPGRVTSEVQDGRELPYPSDSFDHAITVSVLEHIPEEGDSEAIRELARVVRPGGRIVVTVPFDREYRESWVDHDVYERAHTGSDPVFWERHYDSASLRSRLIEASGGELLELEHWGEGRVGMERQLGRLRAHRLDLAAAPFEALLSSFFLRRADVDSGRRRPMAAFLTLRVA